MNHNRHITLLIIAVLLSTASALSRNLTLHYDKPAEFFEEALVIGNGTLGATIYGGTSSDQISLNDITLWSGEPENGVTTPDAYKALPEIRSLLDSAKYREADMANRKIQGHYSQNYQPLGRLLIQYDSTKGISGYKRTLDLNEAVAATRYTRDGYSFSTEYLASAPDSVIALKITTDNPDGIKARLYFDSLLPHSTRAHGNAIEAEGYAAYQSYPNYYDGLKDSDKHLYDPARGIHFLTVIKAITPDGKGVTAYPTGDIKIDGPREVTILITDATSFNGFDKDPVKEGRDYKAIANRRMELASKKSYEDMRSAHIADYRHFFDRVNLDLGATDPQIAALPTDVQLRRYTELNERNPELEALYFQFGRYLLISCSRTPGVPANLQGLWNEKLLPPWSSNYTSNINLQENYWGAEVTNLSEMHDPLLGFIENLSKTGKTTASNYYGVNRGWCLGHNTDIWAMTCPVGLNGGDPSWASWNMGGAWVATHIWERYQFTKDKEFLMRNYPLLKGAAEFCMEWLIEKDGKLMTSPGTSPENKFMTPDGYAGATSCGNTSDIAMTRECLLDALAATRELGIDKKFASQLSDTLSRLQPYKIGHNGNLQEWYNDWPDQDPRHRHQSHLFGLYPGHHLSVDDTPELAAAAARTLEIKGDETTGWSTGWRVNLYARLRDSKNAYHIYRKLLNYISPDNYRGKDARRVGGTYPNLLDAHSPFQIDGNFGGSAGVAEMLIQSTPESITLLPAIPDDWSEGEVKGLCARGGFTVDFAWKDGKVKSATVTSRSGGSTKLHYNGTTRKLRLKPGQSVDIHLM